jgi:glucose/arabinose dehydrogenase
VNTSLTFPLFLTAPPGDTLRLFVVERGGAIKVIDRASGNVIATFLNISNLLPNPLGNEQGLLGLAFDPQYTNNRRFYVSYTDTNGNSVIARYLVDQSNANSAVPTADRIILTVTQPFTNHNGGMIAFGPVDNFLYIGLGDGGSGGDPLGNGQNNGVLLGKLLRIDVSQGTAPQPPYSIPSDNPFVGQVGVREEIWSFGLRNPWRFSFDRQTRDLYVADVGQGTREEVNVSTGTSAGKGINYGWNITEGSLCFPIGSMCSTAGLMLPLVEYDHSGSACSITGGYVYRGSAVPALQGTYFYGDFCARFVRSFRLVNGMATEQADWAALNPGGNITSFGEDEAGELYIMTSNGGLFRIVQN